MWKLGGEDQFVESLSNHGKQLPCVCVCMSTKQSRGAKQLRPLSREAMKLLLENGKQLKPIFSWFC